MSKPDPKLKTKDITEHKVLNSEPIGPDEKPFMTVYGLAYLQPAGKMVLVGEMPVIFNEKEADRLARELNRLTSGSLFASVALRLFHPEKPAKALTPAKKPRKRK